MATTETRAKPARIETEAAVGFTITEEARIRNDVRADYDRAQGRETREGLLEKYVDEDVLIIGTHFATPTAGHVKSLGEGRYWLDVGSA